MTSQGTQPVEALRPQVSEAKAEVDVESIEMVLARAASRLSYRSAAPTFYERRGKRLLDITLGTVLCIGLLPVMAVAALAVLLLSGWPVFYCARRLGRHGRPFRMLKLRTMVNGAHHMLADLLEAKPLLAREYKECLKLPEDPRRTRIGAILRRLSIDELPQFWQVITGEMSLVGPRPYAVEEIALLSSYPEILDSTPAITGPWQVAGRNNIPPQVRIALDAKYVANITFAQDLRYVLATLRCLARADGQ
jgi:lipopolysaccharide/colanic/teichoic acid biosynthesis glycosyltransferase